LTVSTKKFAVIDNHKFAAKGVTFHINKTPIVCLPTTWSHCMLISKIVPSAQQAISMSARQMLTNSDLALVSIGRSHVRIAAMAQQTARVPSANWGWPCSTRSTVRNGDKSAPKREQALHTPSPNDRTCVGYTCKSTQADDCAQLQSSVKQKPNQLFSETTFHTTQLDLMCCIADRPAA